MTRPNGRTGKGKKKSPACVSRRWDHILYASKTVSRVLYSTVIYLDVLLPARSSHLWEAAGPACCFHHGVAPDRVYSDGRFRAVGCALTAPFHPYRTGRPTRRYISVALFLKSPSAGVTRYPCPVEPGLSSWRPFRVRHATACPACPIILQEPSRLVNERSRCWGNFIVRRGAGWYNTSG